MLNDADLVQLTDHYINEAVNYIEQEIAEDRIKAQRFYHGKKFGNEQKGRSQVVSTDLRDSIEWTLPTLLRMFFAGDHVIEFSPVGDEDVRPATLLTELFDYIVLRKNSGFMIYYTWFKDALLKRNGFVRAYWNTEKRVEKTEYVGLTEPEYQLLKDDGNFEEEEVDEITQEMEIPGLPQGNFKFYDVKGSYTYEESSICIAAVPPEEVFTLATTRTNKDSKFWLFKTRPSLSDLRERGYEIPDDVEGEKLLAETYAAEEIRERHRKGYSSVTSEQDMPNEIEGIDPSSKIINFYEMNVKVDMKGDGTASWWQICRVGDKIVYKEPILYPMIASLTPVPTPHQLFGDGYYELVGKFQELKTSLHRIVLDYIYYSTNPRAELATTKWDSEFTLSDWMNNAPNGAVRVKDSGAVTPIYPAPLNQMVMPLLEYFGESQKENSVGVTRYNQGQDANSLNKTATGIGQVMSAAASRIELIARVFAETGIKQLANMIKDLLIEYPKETSNMVARLTNGDVTDLDVEQLKGNYDFVVTVGTGNADKTQMLESLLALFGLWEKFIQLGAGPMAEKQLVTYTNMYQGLREFVKAAGLKNVGMYTNDPSVPPDPPPPPPQKSSQDIAAEMQAQFLQVEAQVKQKEAEIKEYEARTKVQLEQNKLALTRQIELLKLDIQRDKLQVEALSKGVNDGKPAKSAANR